MAEERFRSLDIAKGIGIILVVWAHASGPGTNWIYQFHMPLFFLISGYLFNDSNTAKDFVVRKIHSLYVPFVFWNLVVVFLRTMHNLTTSVPTAIYTFKAITKTVLLLDKDNQFLGATWFLGALFFVSVLYKLIDTVLKEWKYKRSAMTMLFVFLSMLGFAVNLPYFFSRTLILGMFYPIGVVVKENRDFLKRIDSPISAIVCLVLFILIATQNRADMGHNEYTNPLLFVVGACMASYFIIWLSMKIDQKSAFFRNGLSFLGRRSIDILIWQFVFFRVVIATQLMTVGKPVSTLLDYYPIFSSSNGWWMIYTILGIILPILWCDFLRMGKWGKALKKIHAI